MMNETTKHSSKRTLQKENSRRLLMNAAVTCFSSNGFHNTGIAQIAKEAGMSAGNLYRHFSGKQDFIIALVEEQQYSMIKHAQKNLNTDNSIEGIIQLLHDYIYMPVYSMDQKLWLEILSEASRNDEIQNILRKNNLLVQQSFQHLLAEAVVSDSLDPSYQVESLALWLQAMINGLTMRIAIDKNFDINQHFDQFAHIIRRTLQSR
ncbi:TetR/AcrR family transcriptional regulator [Paenibacillus sp. WLX1005]|uniref:TetR/AcrR family transcriptional regulator n=1 Tax=Paenibacillus sp. WLX1005 TaxID=3243766 RepID=UPI003983F79A